MTLVRLRAGAEANGGQPKEGAVTGLAQAAILEAGTPTAAPQHTGTVTRRSPSPSPSRLAQVRDGL